MSAIPLECWLGRPAPDDLAENLASLVALPDAVQASFAEVLEPNLQPIVDDRAETRVKRYCMRHEIAPEQLAPSVKACRFLFTSAVHAGADRHAFARDVSALLPDDRARKVLDVLLPLFDEAVPRLTLAAAFRSVAEHGKVVRAVHWRIEVIKASDHAAKLDVPVATITLQYQEGPNAGQASYQLLPDQVKELEAALAALKPSR